MKFTIAKKLEMTQLWQGEKVVAVTKLLAGPCVAVQVKDDKKDGYKAVQLGFGERKEKNIKKPQKGHMKDLGNFQYLREFRLDNGQELNVGDIIKVDTFAVGDKVKVSGTSKGRGFQGVVKRHGFGGQIKTHGTKDQLRMPGSAGATGPAHIFKGQKMPGRMGGDKVSVTNLEIIDIDIEHNILFVKGAVPGAVNGLLLVSAPGELKVSQNLKEEVKPENKKDEDKDKKEETKETKDSVEKNEDKKEKDKKEEISEKSSEEKSEKKDK